MSKAKRARWGHIQYISEGTYRLFWDEAPDADGKRRQCSLTIHGSRDDAEMMLARKRLAQQHPSNGDPSTTWAQLWEEAVVPTFVGLQRKTIADYRRTWSVELEPRIADHFVVDTTWDFVNSVIGDINAPSVQRSAHRLWKKMCNIACRKRLMTYNPVDRAIAMKPIEKRKKAEIYGADVWPLLAGARGTRYYKLIILCLIGGLRLEEATPLLKTDIVRSGSYAVVRVDKALTVVLDKKEFKSTKNESSVREVFIADPFASALLAEVEKCETLPLFPGPRPPKGSEPNESWYAHPERMSRNWRGWCERHGLSYICPRDMRTNYSDLHADAGSADSVVSLSMGHSDGTTRGRNYQRRRRAGLERVADNLAHHLMSCAPCYALLRDSSQNTSSGAII